ncbi:aspartate/glutamate racemase family protein [Chloroflexota bacterium]
MPDKKYRFCLITPIREVGDEKSLKLSKEQCLPGYNSLKNLLDDIDWDLQTGPLSPFGPRPLGQREGFCFMAAARLPIVREACESGKYNAIVLLGGADPGFVESREIAMHYDIPVMSCAFAQMHLASTLGNKFSIIDISEPHNMALYDLVVRYRFTDRCASIRNIDTPLTKRLHPGGISIEKEEEKALRGEPSEAVERAVHEAISAIEEDGAEVITFGCSPSYWLRPFVEKGLNEMGWEIPVLEGYSCAITLAKAMVDLGVDVSSLSLPGDRPEKWRRKKVF